MKKLQYKYGYHKGYETINYYRYFKITSTTD